jgi:hypothetical protein
MHLQPATAIDRDSLKLLIERAADGTPFKVRRQHQRLDKAYARNQLYIPPNETEEQKWWRCEARMMLGHYHDWSGWEFRDEWAATLWHHGRTVGAQAALYPVPPWNGLKTDTLYVMGEQGIGDEVFFASCLHECTTRARRVIVECQPRLIPAFERMDVETRPALMIEDGTKRIRQDLPEGTTAWMAIGDLPRMWRLSLRHFPGTPYLTADPAQVERFRHYAGRVGVSWRGAQGVVDAIRRVPNGLSLQYDQMGFEQVERPRGADGQALDLRDDIEGVLGLLANLSEVRTVSTSVAHFAAAMGVPTHVNVADPSTARRAHIFPFKWICRATPGRTPWYGSARVTE